jgi:hypothetical protein
LAAAVNKNKYKQTRETTKKKIEARSNKEREISETAGKIS